MATSLMRMDAGTHFPRRRHRTLEEVLLLSGDLVVEGQKMEPGHYCCAAAGTHSESFTASGCLFLLKASQLDEVIEWFARLLPLRRKSRQYQNFHCSLQTGCLSQEDEQNVEATIVITPTDQVRILLVDDFKPFRRTALLLEERPELDQN